MSEESEISNLTVRSNLMVDEGDNYDHWWHFAPGDLFHEFWYVDIRDMRSRRDMETLSAQQQEEFLKWVVAGPRSPEPAMGSAAHGARRKSGEGAS